jgi:hypothetical protein
MANQITQKKQLIFSFGWVKKAENKSPGKK